MTIQEAKKQAEACKLWWSDNEGNKTFPAGVAFYDERFGEYRLKIDIHPETRFYLKSVSCEGDRILYRVDVVIKKDGRFKYRKPIGDGETNSERDIVMNLWPYTKQLLLGDKSHA